MNYSIYSTSLILMILVLSSWISPQAKAEIIFNPVYLIINAPGGNGFASISITNPTEEAIRMQLSATDFEIGDDLEIKIIKKEEDQESITNYLKISPKQFSLAPKQKKIVRIACNVPTSKYEENKEYKLLLTMTEIGADRKLIPGPSTEAGKSTYGLIINKAINAGTYIRVGKPTAFKYDLKFTDFSANLKDKEIEYRFNYQNTGNIHARQSIGIKIYDKSNDKLVAEQANVGGFIVFPNAEKTYKLEIGFPFPEDKLLITGNYEVEFVISDISLDSFIGDAQPKPYISPKVPLSKP